jgi:hypothetical protein
VAGPTGKQNRALCKSFAKGKAGGLTSEVLACKHDLPPSGGTDNASTMRKRAVAMTALQRTD